MQLINYKQYEIVIYPGANCLTKIYKGTELVDKIKFIYHTKKEIVKKLKEKIDLLEIA